MSAAPLLLALMATQASALQAQSGSGEQDLASVLAGLEAGVVLRVATPRGLTEGILTSSSQLALLLETAEGSIEVALSPADSLWVQGDARTGGALIGGALGLGLVALSCGQTLDECGLDVGLAIVTPALALLGAGIGSSILKWRLVNPAPRSRGSP